MGDDATLIVLQSEAAEVAQMAKNATAAPDPREAIMLLARSLAKLAEAVEAYALARQME